jgi:ParB-like chromosome segregation protein Spo0J
MTRGHLVLEHAINQIVRGHAYRRDVEEDLDELCESIQRVGILNPPTVTDSYVLIAGQRRLAAMEKLGWRVTPVWIVPGVSDKLSQVLAIRDEQTLRKALKPVEQAELYEELKTLYAEDAERRDAATRFGSPHRPDAARTGEDGGAESAPPDGQAKRDVAASNDTKSRVQAARAVTGRDSRTMLEQIGELKRIAADDDEDPIVRQHAAEALLELNEDGKVNGKFLQVKTRQNLAALTRLAQHPDTPDAVRAAGNDELAALTRDLSPKEAAKESGLALERVRKLQAAAASAEKVGWTDVDPLMRQKHQVRKLVDLLRREHGWWERYDPVEIGRYADPIQWDLIASYVDGAHTFVTAATTARDTSEEQFAPADEAIEEAEEGAVVHAEL